jgi:hypothetical protein
VRLALLQHTGRWLRAYFVARQLQIKMRLGSKAKPRDHFFVPEAKFRQ